MQGFNKYYPPDWTPEDENLNKYNGKHALGDRARKLDKGILIVRFELPYNIWCDHCGNHIGMGVRYNAEKSKVGMYYTTPIFNFRCKCHLCQHWFEIRTDPQNARYIVHSGAKQQNQEWDPAENGGVVLTAPSTSDAPPDAFESLEKTVVQKTQALTAAAHLDALESLQSSRWSDPYAASSVLRKSFRKEKKVRVVSEGKAEVTREKYGLGDRVRMEDLRTPRDVGEREEEEREWRAARKEREKREGVREGKRKREREQVGWKDESESRLSKRLPKYSSSKSLSTTSSSKSLPRSASSPALKSLASQLLLNSAIKADPFRSEAIGKERRKSEGMGDLKFSGKRI